MKPSASYSTESADYRTLFTLGRYLWPQGRLDLRIRVALALICLILAKVVNVSIPFFYKGAVDQLSVESALRTLPLFMILGYGIARVGQQAIGELRDFLFARVGQNAQRQIALATFKHMHALSLRYHLDRQTGGLSRIIERGTRGINFVLSFMLFNILPTLLEISLVTGILWWNFGWPMAAIAFGTITAYIIFTLVVTTWRLKFRRAMNESDTTANAKSVDSLLNYETVKTFGNEEFEFERFDGLLRHYETAAVKSQASLSFINIGQGCIIGLGLVGVMTLAAKGVVADAYTIGDFVLINSYLIQLYLPLSFLGFVYREVKQSLIDMEKMFALREVDAEIKDPANPQSLDTCKGAVAFNNVSFHYNSDRGILHNVDFTVPAGKQVAIVGPSGAGKSSIARLMFRFYDVTEGAITIDGIDIRNTRQSDLRARIGIVPQDTVLFNDSIGYNIRYGKPNASDADVEHAAKLAHIHDFVQSLPKGYDTVVGERGLKLSGGEKQRVAIARTILKDPCILVFDEATSALDSHTEKEIQRALAEIAQNRTTVVIAHRLSTVVESDEILVLQEGRIVERGRHQELLDRNGEYAAMWAKQQEGSTPNGAAE